MVNNVNLIGRIATDLEVFKIGDDKSVANFTLAVNRNYDSDNADFIKCSAFNKMAENLVKYQYKGNLVSVSGSLKVTRKDNEFYTNVVVKELNFLEKSRNPEYKES